ncbi:MAG: ABC transporter permease [Elusimicrobiota bacterium]|jgi:ABC-2 type transport system permease protein|nr:ABC transporter permease [Elusimicrobiota bacterium]
MNIRWLTLLGFIKKEFIQISRDKKMIGAIFFVPVLQLIMFGGALTSEVKNIAFVVISPPSQMARDIQSKALASGWSKEVKHIDAANAPEPAQLLISRKAEAVLAAPKEGFEYALERGDKPLQLLVNAVNAQRAQQVEVYVKQITAQAAAKRGVNINALNLIQTDIRIMFNHYMNTSDFMLPALMAMASFVVILAVCGMSITKEKETGTMEKLIASPAGGEEVLLGKTIPYMLIGLLIILFMFSIALMVFGVSFRGMFWQLLVTGFCLMLTTLSVATLISAIARTQQQALMASILFILPAVLLCGVFFPVENIPRALRWLSYLDPMTYAMINFRNTFLKGGDAVLFWQNTLFSLAYGAGLGALAFKNFKSTLN